MVSVCGIVSVFIIHLNLRVFLSFLQLGSMETLPPYQLASPDFATQGDRLNILKQQRKYAVPSSR